MYRAFTRNFFLRVVLNNRNFINQGYEIIMNNLTSLLILSMFFLLPNTVFAYSDFSKEEAGKSVVLIKVSGLLGSESEINAVAITPNLLIATSASVSGLSVTLSIDENDAAIVDTFKAEGLVLLSYPTGGLKPAVLSKAIGQANRNLHVVRHGAEKVSGTLLDSTTDSGLIDMSMSKTLLTHTGSGVFNNCGELIGLYDKSESTKISSALSLNSISTVINGVSGAIFSKTDCPSDAEKLALAEESRILERQKIDAEAAAKQEAAEEALRVALEKVSKQEKATQQALAEAEDKSAENLEEAQSALALEKKSAAEKQALAEEARIALEAEKAAAEEALRKSKESAVASANEQEKEQKKRLIIGTTILALLLVLSVIIFIRRSKKNDELMVDASEESEAVSLLSFDVLIRGEDVGVKVPAELIARARGVVIGRSAIDCDFVIDSPELSRSHIRLTEKDDILYLEDLGSANGTTLNGLKLQPAQLVALHHGDELELAASIFSVEFQQR